MVFAIVEASGLLLETGFRKPISRLDMNDKAGLRSSLLDFHCLLKSKAASDQFAEGLSTLSVLDRMRAFPALLFLNESKPLTASKCVITKMHYTNLILVDGLSNSEI